jgi:choline dehydrogenase-like flavoprotein
MRTTRAERQFRALLILWLVLFGGGTIVLGVATRLPSAQFPYSEVPLLALVWVGQLLLFLCTFYLNSGIRDNELNAFVIFVYKLVSGTGMIVIWLAHGVLHDGLLLALGGGVLDYVMGALTFGLWLRARRTLAQRMPFAYDALPSVTEEPGHEGALRWSLRLSAVVFALMALWLLIGSLGFLDLRTGAAQVAGGNAVAVYVALAILCILGAETPRRRAYAQDITVLTSIFAAIVLWIWPANYAMAAPLATFYRVAALVALVHVVLTLFLRARSASRQRPSRFFGSWLHLVCEAFAEVSLKSGPGKQLLTPREVTDVTDDLLRRIPSERLWTIKIALAFIELGGLLRFQSPLTRMGRLEREQYLEMVFERGFGPFRSLIKIKQLIFFAYYSDPNVGAELGFVKVEDRAKFHEAQEKHQLPVGKVVYPPVVTGSHLEADICVIGSGAGGAVIASRLAEAGKRVVVLEGGPYLQRDRVSFDEGDMQARVYRDGGLQLTLDYSMYVLQGRVVGGSTFVNNGVSFEIPDAAFRAWQNLGANLDRAQLENSFQRVSREIQVIDLEKMQQFVERGSLKFQEGCRKLGLQPGWFKVNLPGCIGCGYCTIGCAYDKKMSVDRSYIPRALAAGALLVSECEATEIEMSGAQARAVKGRRADGTPLTVQAKQIVVAGGAIQSSLLLGQSGIKHNVGTRLGFNVGSWVFGQFPEPIDSFDGIQMCAYLERPRYFLETIAMSPGAFAAALPGWFTDHFDNMRQYRYFAVAGALVGSQSNGRVRLWRGSVMDHVFSPIDFQLSLGDLRQLREGVRQVARVFFAAGATRVVPATFTPLEFSDPGQLYRLDDAIVENDDLAFGSAHPQGGNPMSDDPEIGVVNSRFQVHGFDNLFVCDASVFPTTIRANPQLTVMSLADYAACEILRM